MESKFAWYICGVFMTAGRRDFDSPDKRAPMGACDFMEGKWGGMEDVLCMNYFMHTKEHGRVIIIV